MKLCSVFSMIFQTDLDLPISQSWLWFLLPFRPGGGHSKVVKLQHKAYTTCPFSSSSSHTAPCSHAHPCQNWPITIILLESSKPSHLLTLEPRRSNQAIAVDEVFQLGVRPVLLLGQNARWVGEFVESLFLWGPSWSGVGTSPVKDGFFSNKSAIRRLTCNVGGPQLR